MSYMHRKYDPREDGPDEGWWEVHFAIDEAELPSFRRSAPLVIPAEKTRLYSDDDSNDATFTLRVHASTAEDAIFEAQYQVEKIRSDAEIEGPAPDPIGYISPSWLAGSLARKIAAEAHELQKAGRYDFAVLRAHTAFELQLRQDLERLLTARVPGLKASDLLGRPIELSKKQLIALIHLVTGTKIDTEPWWPAYVAHKKRRNAIAHDGVSVTQEESQSTLRVLITIEEWLFEARKALDDDDSPADASTVAATEMPDGSAQSAPDTG